MSDMSPRLDSITYAGGPLAGMREDVDGELADTLSLASHEAEGVYVLADDRSVYTWHIPAPRSAPDESVSEGVHVRPAPERAPRGPRARQRANEAAVTGS